MMSQRRMQGGAVASLWLLAGAIVVLRATMQFTSAGGSAPAGSIQMQARHVRGRQSKTVAEAYSPYSTGNGQQDWRYPQGTSFQPENYGFGAGAFVGLVMTALLSAASNAYVAGIFLLFTTLLTALTHYTARKTPAQTSYSYGVNNNSWQQRGRW